jgi:hypothetical protein
VTDQHLERWQVLSMMAVNETDPRKFAEIIKDINQLLTEKGLRLGTDQNLDDGRNQVFEAFDKIILPAAKCLLPSSPLKKKRKPTMPGVTTRPGRP